MDFHTIREKLYHNIYKNSEDFHDDMILVFNNCRLYYGTSSATGQTGMKVRIEYHRLLNMYNFVERFQNYSEIHPSQLLIQELHKKIKKI